MHNRLTRTVLFLVLTLGALLATTGSALATVNFDPETGTGYVDKADVQGAFGWKDQTFQANARKLEFRTVHLVSWTWECLIGGEAVTFVTDQQFSREVDSTTVGTLVRKNLVSVTGVTLTGFTASSDSGSPASCPSGDPVNVTSGTSAVLYVDFRNQSEPIWSS